MFIKKLVCWIRTRHEHYKTTESVNIRGYECINCGHKWYRVK